MRHDGVYTPQVVVNGRVAGVGADPGEIEGLMSRADRGASGPEVVIAGGSAVDRRRFGAREAADVWLVRYDPRTLEVAIKRGENAGKTLPHKNIVRDIVRLGELERQGRDGSASRRTIRPEPRPFSSRPPARARSSPPRKMSRRPGRR